MRTPLCDLLGIGAPVIQAAIGPWSNAELTAAVSAAGGLGSLGSSLLTTERVRADIARVRELTKNPFALNLTARPFSEEVFSLAPLGAPARAVAPIPVVAAGGIADGCGLAAALVLGAQGVNVGTRFLACTEAGIDASWQEAIAAAESEEAVKVESAASVFPPASPGGFGTLPRSLRTQWIERWNAASSEELEAEAGRLGQEVAAAVTEGRGHELVPFTGQSVGLVHDVPSAAEIVREMVAGAAEALRAAREGAPNGRLGRLEGAAE